MVSRKGVVMVLAVLTAVMFVPVVSAEGTGLAFYEEQLDDIGTKVYDELGRPVEGYPQKIDCTVSIEPTRLFNDPAAAVEHARTQVQDALAAKFYNDPTMVYLWDLPLRSVEVGVVVETVNVGGTSYSVPCEVSFELSLPESMKENTSEKVQALKAAAKAVSVTGDNDPMKVKSVVKYLRTLELIEPKEGEVGNAYELLVKGKSTTAGFAAAFTYICIVNNIDAVTVKGDVYKTGGTEPSEGFWNMVEEGGLWYAVDVMYSKDWSTVMAGANTTVGLVQQSEIVLNSEKFQTTHELDLDLSTDNGLVPPQLNRDAYDYPDDRSFLEKYGSTIVFVATLLVIAGTLYYAARRGDV